MRKLLFILIIFLLPVVAHATVFISEDWETGTPTGCWPCEEVDCSTTFNNWTPYAPTLDTNAGLSTTQKNSGARSYYQYKVPSTPDACNLVRNISGSPTTIYVRFYIYFGTGWTTSWASTGHWCHWIFTNSAYSGTGFRLNLTTNGEWGTCPAGDICMLPEGDGASQWWSGVSPAWEAGVDIRTLIGTWTCFEYKMQISGSNIILTEWINGELTRGPCTGPGQDTSSFNKIIISGYDNSATSASLDFYIDDIVVSDAYIGPLEEGDTTPPTITNVTSDKTNGSYNAGEVIDIDVTFSEAVTSTGNVTVTLETGDTDRTCTFTVSGATTGTCNYTVQAGDTSGDLTVKTIAGTIKDAAENEMVDFAPATNLAANKALVIDTTAPVVTISTSDPSNIINDSLSISGTASDAVGVTSCKFRLGSAPDDSNGTGIDGTTSWSGTATGFSEGANTLYVGCTDAAGNWGSDSITVNYTIIPAKVRGLSVTGVRLQ